MSDQIVWQKTISDVNDDVLVNLERPHPSFYACFLLALALFLTGIVFVGFHTTYGLGLWKFAPPVYWAVDITNFVFWVGIGHAGTLISAILFLFRAKWRNTVNRSAEAMTIFAVMCAAVFPLIHMGRMWLGAYWALPLPNTNNLWVNFRSPLVWDVFAISTYFTTSLLFWYMGLVPDLASIRDRT
jgi:molybdopterin-containing oxidoreductase family membrane subunit